jgi:hypothetical protein
MFFWFLYGHDKLIDNLDRYSRYIALYLNWVVSVKDAQAKLRDRVYRDDRQKGMLLSCGELVRRFALYAILQPKL